MCVRTKTTYGCGHAFKTTNECDSSRCKGLERFSFDKEGDCRDCKAGGKKITRGREGLGRYAREHRLQQANRRETRQPLSDVSSNVTPRRPVRARSPPATPSTSPWVLDETYASQEKLWSTPPRREADSGWLREHAERQKIQSPSTSHRDSDEENHTRQAPSQKHSSTAHQRRTTDPRTHIQTEIITIPTTKSSSRPHNPPHRPHNRYDSYESFPSATTTTDSHSSKGSHYIYRNPTRNQEIHITNHFSPSYTRRDPYHTPSKPRKTRPAPHYGYTNNKYSTYSSSPGYEAATPSVIEIRPPDQYGYGVPASAYGYSRDGQRASPPYYARGSGGRGRR